MDIKGSTMKMPTVGLILYFVLVSSLPYFVKCSDQKAPGRILPSLTLLPPRAIQSSETNSPINIFDTANIESNSYKGLVGRPGIDFPVLTHIPRTVFQCENHGNGYFADLETRCQVFHICDDGKKISFLCPNGTIFRQLDLICDWWFKVDCASTPNHYAESTEMLVQATRARLQSKHPIAQPINPNDQRLQIDLQYKRLLLDNMSSQHSHQLSAEIPIENEMKLNRRMDAVHLEEPAIGNFSGIVNRFRSRKGRTKKLFTSGTSDLPDRSQSASFASIAQKMFDTYYDNDQKLVKISGRFDERPDSDSNNTTEEKKSKEAAKTSNNNNALDYIPYTTARKLNLNGKFTQFYSPTVPTFLTRTAVTTNNGNDSRKSTSKTKNAETVDKQSYRQRSIDTQESVMDHAMEIMKTIESLKIEDIIKNGDAKVFAKTFNDQNPKTNNSRQTSGPSEVRSEHYLLHTPAINSKLKQDSVEFSLLNAERHKRPAQRKLDIDVGNRPLLTRNTLNAYDRLFYSKQIEKHTLNNNTGNDLTYIDSTLDHDLEGQASRYPVLGMTNSSQIRELAQIFTHALSAYLQDPIAFRQILTEIRPKAPTVFTIVDKSDTFGEVIDTTTSSPNIATVFYAPLKVEENLESSDLSDTITPLATTASSYSTLPTDLTTTQFRVGSQQRTYNSDAIKEGKSLSIQLITSRRNELADEVNGELGTQSSTNYFEHGSTYDKLRKTPHKLDSLYTTAPLNEGSYNVYSDMYTSKNYPDLSTTTQVQSSTSETTETVTTFKSLLRPPLKILTQALVLQTPKSTTILEDDEELQRAQSGSILGSSQRKKIYDRHDSSKYTIINLENFKHAYANAADTTTISTSPSTVGVNSFQTVNETTVPQNHSRSTTSYTVIFDPLTINDELMELHNPNPTIANLPASHQINQYILNDSYKSKSSLVSVTGTQTHQQTTASPSWSGTTYTDFAEPDLAGMQKKANEMFGDLSDAQANKLMSVMKMADTDTSMRKLILLLIRTCGDDPSASNDESRKALLDALINVEGVNTNSDPLSYRNEFILTRDAEHRQGRLLADVISNGNANGMNITGTTENYAASNDVQLENNTAHESSEVYADEEEFFKSQQQTSIYTTAATTIMQYASYDAETSYLPMDSTREGLPNKSDVKERTQITTQLPPDFQTTAEHTTTEPTTESTIAYGTTGLVHENVFPTTRIGDVSISSVESFESNRSDVEKDQHISTFHRHPKDLNDSFGDPSNNPRVNQFSSSHRSDTRALELLKSLYSLAARWG
ncbi:uncharacterized protein LOC131207640 [Anopheles bellator]|uniref:uncharacterized protein LOC131207640 n=1 Tax=Anopheles bellator TaxID=139047 RepID=UPI0026494106|nr:uncharacterized protein LOC131207640 [Anopheles bellator]